MFLVLYFLLKRAGELSVETGLELQKYMLIKQSIFKKFELICIYVRSIFTCTEINTVKPRKSKLKQKPIRFTEILLLGNIFPIQQFLQGKSKNN